MNYSELKRLAEAFPSDLDWDGNAEPFFNGPSGESMGGGPTGFYSVFGQPFEIDDEMHDGHEYVSICTKEFAEFLCSARAGVLALIAENETLRIGNTDLRNDNKSLRGSCEAIGKLYKSAKRDRNAFRRECVRLKAEVEALRKDAERYRWLRSRLPGQPYRVAAIVYSEGPDSVDASIDAAMESTA